MADSGCDAGSTNAQRRETRSARRRAPRREAGAPASPHPESPEALRHYAALARLEDAGAAEGYLRAHPELAQTQIDFVNFHLLMGLALGAGSSKRHVQAAFRATWGVPLTDRRWKYIIYEQDVLSDIASFRRLVEGVSLFPTVLRPTLLAGVMTAMTVIIEDGLDSERARQDELRSEPPEVRSRDGSDETGSWRRRDPEPGMVLMKAFDLVRLVVEASVACHRDTTFEEWVRQEDETARLTGRPVPRQ